MIFDKEHVAHWGYAGYLISQVPHIKSYLELGIEEGKNFAMVPAEHKVSVDVDPRWNATYQCSTDEYFAEYNEIFEVIYIDAEHEISALVRDYNNAVDRCTRILFMHDLIPLGQEYTAKNKSGNCYMLLYHLVVALGIRVFTLNVDCGLSFVVMPTPKVEFEQVEQLSYGKFAAWVAADLRLWTFDELAGILQCY